MPTTLEIRALIPDVDCNRWSKVQAFPVHGERQARIRYDELVQKYPGWYFELVKVQTTEETLEFTAQVDPEQLQRTPTFRA